MGSMLQRSGGLPSRLVSLCEALEQASLPVPLIVAGDASWWACWQVVDWSVELGFFDNGMTRLVCHPVSAGSDPAPGVEAGQLRRLSEIVRVYDRSIVLFDVLAA